MWGEVDVCGEVRMRQPPCHLRLRQAVVPATVLGDGSPLNADCRNGNIYTNIFCLSAAFFYQTDPSSPPSLRSRVPSAKLIPPLPSSRSRVLLPN